MPAKLERCVQHVMAQGHDKSSAYAICTVALRKGLDAEVAKVREHMTKAAEERPIVRYGVVLRPDDVDQQGDIISQEELDKTLVGMQKAIAAGELGMGEEHEGEPKSELKAVRAFKAAKDLELEGEPVKTGTLLLRLEATGKIADEIESGDFGGISLDGKAIRLKRRGGVNELKDLDVDRVDVVEDPAVEGPLAEKPPRVASGPDPEPLDTPLRDPNAGRMLSKATLSEIEEAIKGAEAYIKKLKALRKRAIERYQKAEE